MTAHVEGLRFAYADPPYPGKAKKHYGDDPRAREVNFPVLIGTLVELYPDGWALSCNSTNLRALLPLCPADVRVMAWVKRFAKWKKGVNPAYAWEPVIVRGGRKYDADAAKVRDWVDAVPILGGGVTGQKPPAFCRWLLAVLNVQPEDELHDLFPGSGTVGRHAAAGRLAV